MADLLNYSPTSGELPPQAPEPVSTLADIADIAPAPTPTETVRTAAYGDKGAQQYADLAAAGNMRPSAGLAGLAATPAAAPPAAATPGGVMPSDLMQLFGDIAYGAAGQPGKGTELALERQRLAASQQQQQLAARQAAQGQAKADIEFLDKLKGIAPQYRAAMMNDYFTTQGRSVPPAIAQMVGDQTVLRDLTSPATIARVMADPQFAALYMSSLDKPKDFLSLLTDLRKNEADADKAVADAEKAATEATAAPAKAKADAAKAALDIAGKIRQSNKPPTADELEVLDAAGMAAWQVPIPGVAGGKMWTTGPKNVAPPNAVKIEDVRSGAAEKASVVAKAKEEAALTAATRTMKEAAPKVLHRIDRVEKLLAMTETGPAKGRWKELWTGKGGAKDPAFTALRTQMRLLSTLMMRMHVGARGSEGMMKHFESMFADAAQDPANVRASLEEARDYANDVAGSHEGDEVVAKGRGGSTAGAATPPPGSKIIKFSDL